MTFIKFLFVILLVLPVGVALYFFLRKLVDEYNLAMKKERETETRRKAETPEPVQRGYRRDNPRYDAYRKKMEHNQSRATEPESRNHYVQERVKKRQEDTANTSGMESGQAKAGSKRKRRKERKNKKKDREEKR